MQTLLLSLSLAADLKPVQATDLATLTQADSLQLTGERHLFLVRIDSAPWSHDGYTIFDCVGKDATVWLRPGQQVADIMLVEATLGVVRHKASNGFPAFVELRLMDARRLR